MFGSFHWHYFRIPRWSGCCLATVCALLLPTVLLADIVLDTGPFEGQVTLTNLTFVSLEEYDAYKHSILNQITLLEGNYLVFYGQIEIADTEAYQAWLHCNQAITEFNIWIHTESSATPGNGYARRAITETNLAQGRITSARSELDTLRSEANSVSNSIQSVKSAVESDAYLTTGIFATSAGDDSSGGCQCPDYTTILQTIQSNLYDTMNMVRSIRNYCDTIDSNLDTILWDYIDVVFNDLEDYFLYPYYDIITGLDDVLHTGSGAGASGNYRSLGQGLGYVFRTNALASALSYALTGQIEDQLSKSIWQSSLSPGGSSIATAIAEALNPIRRMFSWDATDHTAGYSPTERQILNFLWTRNIHPTNTFANPLFVTNTSPMTFEITPDSAGSVEHPINVSVGNPDVVVNMDGVTVTNKLALVVTTQDSDPLNVNVVNFDDLTDILDQYFKNGSSVDNAETDQEEENDESEEELDDDINADGRDPQFYLSVDSFHTALTKYRQMLVSIDQLIPDSANPPRFYFDYSFKFSSAGSDPSSDSESIQVTPIGPDPDDVSHMGRVLSVFRSFCSVIWLGVVLVTALWLVKWSLFGLSYATAISMTIASGDLSALAKQLPGFIKDLLSAGDA